MNANPQDGFTGAVRRCTDRSVGKWLAAAGVSPNQVTLGGALICALGCLVFACQSLYHPLFWWGLGIFVLGAASDFIDGSVARCAPERKTPFGGTLDSLTDRPVEVAMFTALGWVMMKNHHLLLAAGCMSAIGGSLFVSYARLKAESLGLKGDVGLGDRAVRMAALGIFLLPAYWWSGSFCVAIIAVNLLAWETGLHRALHVRQQLEKRETLIEPHTRRFIGSMGFLTGITVGALMMLYFRIDTPW